LKSVGLSRTVRLDWLDAVSAMCLAQEEPAEIRQRLFKMLESAQPGPTERERIVDTLMRAWVKADPDLKAQGLEMSQRASTREDRVWLHYGMILAQYPFFRTCQAAIGQIARTEDQVTRVAIKQRIAREMGNLGGNERAIERLFVTLVDWGVLIPDGKQFIIQRCVFPASVLELEQWVLDCALQNYPTDGVPFNDLLALPELFPFKFSVRIDDLRASELFEVQQQGLDLVMIQRKMASAGPARLI
jgi:hypothetical protein